jgi:hypothetical protein
MRGATCPGTATAVPLEDAEIDRLVDGGVRIFLRAYGAPLTSGE